jgi:heterodisulfide reductase subunit A
VGIVLVAGCEFPTCHYISGNYTCEKRIEYVKRKLAKKGVDPDRLQTLWISAAQGKKFSETVSRISERLLNSAAGGSRF